MEDLTPEVIPIFDKERVERLPAIVRVERDLEIFEQALSEPGVRALKIEGRLLKRFIASVRQMIHDGDVDLMRRGDH